jgi:succinate-acetate transporter protein
MKRHDVILKKVHIIIEYIQHKQKHLRFVHVYTVHHFHFHFIVPLGALYIKRNFNTIVLVLTLSFRTLQIFI